MHTYTLPDPRPVETAVGKLLSGSTKRLVEWKTFAAGEHFCRALDVEETVCVVGRSEPPGDNLVRTLLLLDTARRSGAKNIHLVMPYLAYARQDSQNRPGDPVSVSCLLRLFAAAGADQLIAADLHSFRPVESSPIKIVSVSVLAAMASALAGELAKQDYTVVAVDRGGQTRAEAFARSLGHGDGAVWVEKVRDTHGTVAAKGLVGHFSGGTAVIVDDMVDTGGSVVETVRLLRRRGAERFYLCVTHPVFSRGAARRILGLGFAKILVSDTLPLPREFKGLKHVRVFSAAPLLARAVMGG